MVEWVEIGKGIEAVHIRLGSKYVREVTVPVTFYWSRGASCLSCVSIYLLFVTLQTGGVQYGMQKWAVGGEPGKRTCFSSCPLVMGIYGIVFKIGTVSLKLMGLSQELFSSGCAP